MKDTGENTRCTTLSFCLGEMPHLLEARGRIELPHKGFADLSLTTWVPRQENGAGNGIRTRDFDLGKVALYH
jgi:hypothetical protein